MISKLLSSFAAKVLNAAGLFVLLILTSRYFGPSGRGELSLFVANMTLVQLLNEIVIGPAMVYLVTRHKLTHIITIAIVWSVIFTGIGVFILDLTNLSKEIFINDLYLTVLLTSIYSAFMMILQGEKKFTLYNILAIFQITLLLGGFSIFLHMGNTVDIFDYIFYFQVSYLIPVLGLFPYLARKINMIDFVTIYKEFKSIVKTGFTAQLSNILNFTGNRISYYLIALVFLSEAELGIYSISVSVIESVFLISYSIAFIQYPIISNSDNKEKNQLITLQFLKLNFWITLPAVISLAVLPDNFYQYIFGKDFSGIQELIILLAPGIIFTSLSKILWNYFNGIGSFQLINYSVLLSMVIAVSLNSILIKIMGINGAAIATFFSAFAQWRFFSYSFSKKTGYAFKKLLPGKNDFMIIKKI